MNIQIPVNVNSKDKTKDKRYKQLDKMRAEHDFRILKTRLQNNMEIEELNLANDLKLATLNNRKLQIEKERATRKLERAVTLDDSTIKSGKMLKFWAVLVTFISTWLTISGGIDNFSRTIYTKCSYVGAVILLQFTVFIIASQETNIKQHFYNHHWKCVLLKYTLLSVSIYNNYLFFSSPTDGGFETAVKILLCIALDLICILMIGLAYDQINLNFFINEEYEEKNILLMWLDNLLFNWKNGIRENYKSNRAKKDIDIDKGEPVNKESTSLMPTVDEIGNRKYTMYLNYIWSNKKKDKFGYYIPTNNEVLNYFKNKKTKTKFYNRDVSNLREILYKESVLISPESSNRRTYFSNEYVCKKFEEENSSINNNKNDLETDTKASKFLAENLL